VKRFLLAIIITFGSSLPSFADHGPFSMENGSSIHELHLGVIETINPTGEPKRFGIRACSTKELDFVNPWRSSQKGTIPFKVRTEEIVAFGLAGSLNSGLNKRNFAGAIGVISNPLSLPLSLVSKEGGNNFQYSLLTINKENGRIAQRYITLYSQKDVNYLNDYLKTSTGYNPGEQLTNKELEKKYLLLKQKKDSISINCGYIEKYGQIRAKKKSKTSTKSSIKVNCNSQVWKKRPQCN
tara:strand:+ start:174 stop:890 length:717 start_codon:yes stop_codon:yes gene_type:complete